MNKKENKKEIIQNKNMVSLPNEIIANIFNYLELNKIINICENNIYGLLGIGIINILKNKFNEFINKSPEYKIIELINIIYKKKNFHIYAKCILYKNYNYKIYTFHKNQMYSGNILGYIIEHKLYKKNRIKIIKNIIKINNKDITIRCINIIFDIFYKIKHKERMEILNFYKNYFEEKFYSYNKIYIPSMELQINNLFRTINQYNINNYLEILDFICLNYPKLIIYNKSVNPEYNPIFIIFFKLSSCDPYLIKRRLIAKFLIKFTKENPNSIITLDKIYDILSLFNKYYWKEYFMEE